MKCPHCLTKYHSSPTERTLSIEGNGWWFVIYEVCPECHKLIVWLRHGSGILKLVHPRAISRNPLPPEVPANFASDYNEACMVLPDSPKASAALSRRCLQNLLREKASVKKADLIKEIEQVIKSKTLPPYLSDAIDAVRNIGNFATHPIKSRSSGEIVEVEPGEAEWNLETLEGLFDFYFVAPKKLEEKKNRLNTKLQDSGKPHME